ncbi:MAG: hypothetical protein CFH19_00291 [Alphaproteobacteria bacterium MarineAlpha5_Bin9]|nr:MAG: hypothetical protein CFH19_00291 [Alphaproteobacteria bacterium MarineAlpha5_Bin9]|tara:strand:- start:3585 stop:4070 length:486 start_codon:yes stop_codon:yes gene_type:complete
MDAESINSNNPIDHVEDIIYSKQWNFSRSTDDELVAEIGSRWGTYRLYFSWSKAIKAINFTITFDTKFAVNNNIHELLALINEKLWIGHFDITSKGGILAFRHTIMVINDKDIMYSQIEEILDIIICECEKYYPAFQYLFFDNQSPQNALEFSSMETIGQA